MNSEEAQAAHKEWGDKPCNHPDIIADRDAAPDEDIWRCLECGTVVGYDEWRRSHNNRS